VRAGFNYRAPVPTAEPASAPPELPTPITAGFALQPCSVPQAAYVKPRYVTGFEPVDMEACFAGGIRIQLRYEHGARWLMWVSSGGPWKRRKDFASPYPEHACRAAECWYGAPVNGWRPAEAEI
jgi:hypothetical protein